MSLEKQFIGSVAQQLNISAHTLRYYEKIGLLAPISKDSGGRRIYSQKDIQRFNFIKRAQRMHFTLKEIRSLIELERADSIDKRQAQKLVSEKLCEIDASLEDLIVLKKDLSRMLDACISSDEEEQCPIIMGMKTTK